MDKNKVRKVVRFGIKVAATAGVYTMVRQFVPYNLSPYGRICCEAGAFFVAMGSQDLIEGGLLRCDAILNNIKNGDPDVIVL